MDIFQLPGILLRRWLYVLVPMVMFIALAAAYVVVVKPTVPVEADIFIDTQGLVAEKPDLVQQVAAQSPDSSILESQIYVIQSSEILNDVVDKLDLTKDPFLYKGPVTNKELARAAVVGALQKHLTIERAGQSFILNMTVKHSNPVQGALIANTIASVYLKKVHEARSDASNRASGAFEQQAQSLAARLRKAEEELEKFKAEHSLVSTGQQGLIIDQQVQGVNTQLLAARSDLGAKRASYQQAQSLTVGSVQDGAIPEALASTALGTMRARYADLLASTNELATSLGANHPQMRAARSQLDGMRQSIEQELTRIRQSLKSGLERSEANVKSLEDRLDQLTKSSLDTSEAGIKARELQSEVDTLRALYKAFLSRSEELGQRDTVNVNNSRIISKAVAVGSSSKLAQIMILIAATLFGFAAGCGVAVLREMMGRAFTRPATVDEKESAEVMEASEPDALEEEPSALVEAEEEEADAPAEIPDEPAAAPVIAHLLPARKAAPSVRFANARSRPDARQIGVSQTVDRILSMSRSEHPSTIILLSPGNDNPGRDLSRDLADALYHQHKDVYFSTGEGAELGERARATDLPLGNVLKFQRLSPIAPRHPGQAAPTFRNFADRHRKADYVIIDARGQEARRHIEELLAQASGILVLASAGDDPGAIDGLLDALAPFKDRMLGTILFEQAA
jgi:uncharacterized protein involved in exopolysaccharide biosynthesis